MWALKEVESVLGTSTGRGAFVGWAVLDCVQKCLEWKKIVGPFAGEETSGEWKSEEGSLVSVPINKIESFVGPLVAFCCILSDCWKAGEFLNCSGEVSGDGDTVDGEHGNACWEHRDVQKGRDSGLQV